MTVPLHAILPADWPAPANVRAFTTLRYGAGISEPPFDTFNLGNCIAADGDDRDTVTRNRAELVKRFALPSPPHWLRQVHGVEVARFDASSPPSLREREGAEQTADASITTTPNPVLAILTADCLPVVFAADDGSEVAAAHAGWRSLAAGVLEQTVAAMHAPAGRILAWLGPAAGPQAYEIGEEVHEAFTAHDPRAASAFVATHPGHWRVDLYALARQRLADAGVTRVYGGGLCSISDPQRFFSHRRDRRSGRMATVVWFS